MIAVRARNQATRTLKLHLRLTIDMRMMTESKCRTRQSLSPTLPRVRRLAAVPASARAFVPRPPPAAAAGPSPRPRQPAARPQRGLPPPCGRLPHPG